MKCVVVKYHPCIQTSGQVVLSHSRDGSGHRKTRRDKNRHRVINARVRMSNPPQCLHFWLAICGENHHLNMYLRGPCEMTGGKQNIPSSSLSA